MKAQTGTLDTLAERGDGRPDLGRAPVAAAGMHVPNIQVMRAVAATMVLFTHVSGEWASLAASRGIAGASRFDAGGTGVDLFFVISGFIMVVTTVPRWGDPGLPGRFALRRLTRIVPLYWSLTTLLLLGSFIAPSLLRVPFDGLGHVVSSYLFWPMLRPDGEVRPILALGWTLNYEMGFYAIFALGLLLPIRRGLPLVAGTLLGLVAWGQVGAPQGTAAAFWTSPILIEFVMGGVVGLVALSRLRLSAPTCAALLALGLAVLLLSGDRADHRGDLANQALLAAAAGAAVLAAACGPQGAAGRGYAALTALGDASYSLYLIHPFLLRGLTALWLRHPALPLDLYGPVAMGVAVIGGWLVYRHFERPLTARVAQAAGVGRTPG